MKTYTYTILKPGGNNTAIVEPLVLNKALKKIINDEIILRNPKVEQVGFIDRKNKVLEMAGGEFCGNATRCAAYLFLNKKPGTIQIKVSGAKRKLIAGIDRNQNVFAEMPIYKNPNRIKTFKNGYIVEIQGITNVVTKLPYKNISKKLLKKKAFDLLRKLNLIQKVKASGVMFISYKNRVTNLQPVVWVKDIKTLFLRNCLCQWKLRSCFNQNP